MADEFSIKQVELELSKLREQLERTQSTPTGNGSIGEVLKEAISEVNELSNTADVAIQKQLASGETTDLHSTMIALEKAEVSFQLMMQIRNKILQAYEEIMRMPI
jgi:flagellar hook-basal body complex protein FliE